MEVRAKKALGQHFLTDQSIAKNIVGALEGRQALEVGPGMGVLTQYLLPRPELALKVVEIDGESVVYLRKHYPKLGDNLIEGDFLKMDLDDIFEGEYSVIGNFPYNISSQIFFKILEHRDRIPEVVCMIQKEVAERIAEKPGTKTYGILSVFLQAWYDIEYLFTVGSGAFNPPPKVQSAVIRLTRNSRTSLGCDEKLFRTVVKTAFGQRRKTLRNSLKPLLRQAQQPIQPLLRQAQQPIQPLLRQAQQPVTESIESMSDAVSPATEPVPSVTEPVPPATEPVLSVAEPLPSVTEPVEVTSPSQTSPSLQSDPIFDLRPERLSVEDFVALTLKLQR